jgi:exodeoxyribonuclease VII large subunit
VKEQAFITLSALAASIESAISDVFEDADVWVLADISNYNHYAQKGHHYFDLVEKSKSGTDILAKLQTAAWFTGNESIKRFERITGQKFKNDIKVLVKVSVEYHKVFGLKLVLQDVDTNFTIGELEKQKQETIKALIDGGFISKIGEELITDNKRLQLPAVIQRIAVVSSAESAGLQDFVHTLENNDFGYHFQIDYYHTVVQGESKAELIINKFVEIFTSAIPYDAVLLIRGGGSQTDFLLFDQLPLAKMIAKFPIPVITGIGHQKNETVADLVANLATKTPTRSAELIIAHNRAFEEKIRSIEKNIIIKAQQLIASQKEQLQDLKLTLVTQSKLIARAKLNELQQLQTSLRNFIPVYFKNHNKQLLHQQALLRTLSPANILKRGFAIIKKDGKTVIDAGKINIGDQVTIILDSQQLESTVNKKTDYNGHESYI